MNQKVTKKYRTILRASQREGQLHVAFADGSDVAIPLSRLFPEYQRKTVNDVQAYPSHVNIVVDGTECEIAWSTIRRIVDHKLEERFAEAATEARYIAGVRLGELRRKRGMTARAVAEEAGISPQSLSRIEQGHHDLVLSTLETILRAMGSSMREFVEMTDQGNVPDKVAPGVIRDSTQGIGDAVYTLTRAESDFSYWSSLPSLTTDLRESIRQADIVLVPHHGFREHVGPVFPVRTEELFRYFKENVPTQLRVELAVEDANYRELALHADIVRIATVLVTWFAAPFAIDVIKEHLKRRLGRRFRTADVRFTLIVDQREGKTASQISYEGPAEKFETTLKNALQEMTAT